MSREGEIPICLRCEEPILSGESYVPVNTWGGKAYMHRECALRSIIGGANHINKLCRCCGGSLDPDPPGLTLREAARAAVAAFEKQKNNQDDNGNRPQDVPDIEGPD